MSVVVLAAAMLATRPVRADVGDCATMRILRMPNGVRFGLIGERKDRPAPTLFVFAHGLETMQQEPGYSEVARLLVKHGVVSVVLDPPGHGEDAKTGEPAAMEGWRFRLGRGNDFVRAFTTRASKMLDDLVENSTQIPVASPHAAPREAAFWLSTSPPPIPA